MRRAGLVGVTNWGLTYDNQYLDRLMAAVSDTGVTVSRVKLAPWPVAAGFARGMRVVHVHWPEYLVGPRTSSSWDAFLNLLRLLRLIAALAVCRILGVRIVWTVHNLGPHEATAAWAAFRAYDLISRVAAIFFVHSRAAGARTKERFPRARGRVVVAAHGHYLGVHPPAQASWEEVRARYGIPPGAFVLLAFGQIRPYKRLAELSHALADADADGIHLLITGHPLTTELADELDRVAAASERVHVDARRIPDAEVSGLYRAADAAVMNYTELFSSGSLLLALSQGVPVVSAESDAVHELAGWPAVSTYRDAAGLVEAVSKLESVDGETRRSAALAAAEAASWERPARALHDAYARVAKGPRRPR